MQTDAIMNIINFNPLPRKEGDTMTVKEAAKLLDFNPLPRKEGDRCHSLIQIDIVVFQSTPS